MSGSRTVITFRDASKVVLESSKLADDVSVVDVCRDMTSRRPSTSSSPEKKTFPIATMRTAFVSSDSPWSRPKDSVSGAGGGVHGDTWAHSGADVSEYVHHILEFADLFSKYGVPFSTGLLMKYLLLRQKEGIYLSLV